MTPSRPTIFISLTFVALSLSAMGSDAATVAATDSLETETSHFALLVEGGSSSSTTLERGARRAAVDLGVDLAVHVVSAGTSAQRTVLERILDDDADGLIVAVARPQAIGAAISAVASAGIPTVLAGHGIDVWRSLGARAFVGQDEHLAGQTAGQKLIESGATKAICVMDLADDPVLQSRCRAARDALTAAGASSDLLYALDAPGDPTGVRDAITARLVLDPAIDAVVATEHHGFAAAIEARGDVTPARDLTIATFEPGDLLRPDFEIGTGGDVLVIDQQPFMQGYLSVSLLGLLGDGTVPADEEGGVIITGPRIIDLDTP